MNRPRSTAARTLVLAGVVLLAGCLGAATPSEEAPADATATSPGTDAQTPTTTATPTATPDPVASEKGCARWVSFWGLGGPDVEKRWSSDSARIGYAVTGNASVLFVASTNGTVLGSKHVSTGDLNYGITADGDEIDFDEPLEGSHNITIRAYADANGNEAFDPGVDRPCTSDGDPVVTSERIDFGQFDPSEEQKGTESPS